MTTAEAERKSETIGIVDAARKVLDIVGITGEEVQGLREGCLIEKLTLS